MKRFLIVVEGEADKKFFSDYYFYLYGKSVPKHSIIVTEGYEKLSREEILQRLRQNSDQGGVNLIIFDADKNILDRRKEIESVREKYGVDFSLFLLPNNRDSGALEDMLEQIINPDNRPVMDCWHGYESELKKVRIPTKTPPTLTIPAKKTKIYAYLETLLGETKEQKKLIKDKERDFMNTSHWDLENTYLIPLRIFLSEYLSE